MILVVGFSLMDLPFRCPAILLTWVAALGALPAACAVAAATRRSESTGWK